MRALGWRARAVPAIPFPPRRPPDACRWDGARGRSPRWPVQALHALPVMARGCPIRARWRSGCVNHRAESSADRQSNGPLVPAQRLAHQPRRRRDRDCLHCMIAQKIGTILPAGTASGCMRWLGGTTPEGRADLPAKLAPAGGAWDGVPLRSSWPRGRCSPTRLRGQGGTSLAVRLSEGLGGTAAHAR